MPQLTPYGRNYKPRGNNLKMSPSLKQGSGGYRRRSPVKKPLLVRGMEAVENFFGGIFSSIAGLFAPRRGYGSGGSRKGAAIFLACFLGVAIIASVLCVYYYVTAINAAEIYLDGNKMGVIKWNEKEGITAEYIQQLAALETADKVGSNIVVNEKVALTPVHAKMGDPLTDLDYIIAKISQSYTYKVEAAVITISGEEIGVLKSKEEADNLLKGILDSYYQEGLNITNAEFVEDVQSETKFVDSSQIGSSDDIYESLTESYKEPKTYVIQSGDTLGKIAQNNSMTLDELLKLNPDYTDKTVLKVGRELTVVSPRPRLSVRTYERVEYPETVPKPVETQAKEGKPKSYSRVLQQGKDGQQMVVADIIRVNGFQTGKNIIKTTLLEKPITEIIEKGTGK